MGKDPSIEELRQILDPNKVFLSIAKITQMALAPDNSVWRAKLEIFPDKEEVVARMTWDQVGPKTGMFGPASVGDLVLVAFADADEESAKSQKETSEKDKSDAKASDDKTSRSYESVDDKDEKKKSSLRKTLEKMLERKASGKKFEFETLRRLDYGGCRLSIAIPNEMKYEDVNSLNGTKVATTYPYLLERYFKEKNMFIL